MLVDSFCRAAEIEVDGLGAQLYRAHGVIGQALGVAAQQLDGHRCARFGAGTGQQLRRYTVEHLGGQQSAGDPDKLGHTVVNTAYAGQQAA